MSVTHHVMATRRQRDQIGRNFAIWKKYQTFLDKD
jgi:hypothetical protein